MEAVAAVTHSDASVRLVPALEWAGEDGEPLGSWVEIDNADWWKMVESVGGLDALAVFSTLTDPDGDYGWPQIYTAWGLRDSDVPLGDICDYLAEDGVTKRRVCRKFVRRSPRVT